MCRHLPVRYREADDPERSKPLSVLSFTPFFNELISMRTLFNKTQTAANCRRETDRDFLWTNKQFTQHPIVGKAQGVFKVRTHPFFYKMNTVHLTVVLSGDAGFLLHSKGIRLIGVFTVCTHPFLYKMNTVNLPVVLSGDSGFLLWSRHIRHIRHVNVSVLVWLNLS